jgi:hypothetical protein
MICSWLQRVNAIMLTIRRLTILSSNQKLGKMIEAQVGTAPAMPLIAIAKSFFLSPLTLTLSPHWGERE